MIGGFFIRCFDIMIEREVVTVCKQIMKSFLCMMLLFGCVLTNIIIVEPIIGETSFSISFHEPYVLPNETLTLQVEGANVEECSITWYRDGQEISAMKNQLTYQVKDSDMQKLIKVEVIYQDQSQSVQMLISKLPVVYIDIEDGKEVTSKDTYLDAQIKIQNSALYAQYGTQYEGKTKIKGRGNSTWGLPKKPYRLKFDKKSDVLGMGSNKHWVLLANYYDTSLLRNTLAYNLAADLDMTHTATVHVDVVINGTKRGNYQLCEHIRIDKTRVNIFDWESFGEDVAETIAEAEQSDKDSEDNIADLLVENLNYVTTGAFTYNQKTYYLADYGIEVPEFTGGFLMEMDEQMDEVSKFYTSLSQPMMFKSPEFIKTNQDMMNYVINIFETFEEAIQSTPNFTAVYDASSIVHYSDLFDINALIDYWWIQEVFYNQDGVRRSTYMYQDLNGKVVMGPVWDFDWSSGGMGEVQATNQWFTWGHNNYQQKQQWYKFLVKDPYFLTLAYQRYQEIRPLLTKMLDSISVYQDVLLESAASNQQIWGTGSFQSNSEKLKNWLLSHINWIDEQMTTRESFMRSIASIDASDFEVQMTRSNGLPLVPAKNEDYMLADGENINVLVNQDANMYVNGKLVAMLKANQKSMIPHQQVIQTKDETNVISFVAMEDGNANMSKVVANTIINGELKPVSLTITGLFQKNYQLGDSAFNAQQLKVEALFNNGTTMDVTNECEISGFDSSKLGPCTMKVTYQDVTESFHIEIKEPTISTFIVDAPRVIDISESTQAKSIKVQYVNGMVRDITTEVVYQDIDITQPGVYDITFTYHKRKYTYRVIVVRTNTLKQRLTQSEAHFSENEDAYSTAFANEIKQMLSDAKKLLHSFDYQKIEEAIQSLETYLQLPSLSRVVNLKAQALDYKTIQLSFDEVESATHYQIYRLDTKKNKWIKYQLVTFNKATFSGVKTGVKYSYRVRAVLNLGDEKMIYGKSSSTKSATTMLTGELTLKIKTMPKQFCLTWNKIQGATRYIIYRKKAGGNYQKVLTLGDVNTYTSSTMKKGTYYYSVRAARYDSIERVMTSPSNEVMGTIQ